jgi:multidrug efflux pump subunit AcrA (membrane-fusion protein)
MVERWQTGLGQDATGTVALGDVVFLPATTTVDAVAVKVGDEITDGDVVLTVATASLQVVIDVPDDLLTTVQPGITVTLGRGEGTAAVVTALRSVERQGSRVVQALVDPGSEQLAAGATVKVTVVKQRTEDALIVPTKAVASRLDGSYAVEVIGAGGTAAWVAVEVVAVSGTKAAITGPGIAAGVTVAV